LILVIISPGLNFNIIKAIIETGMPINNHFDAISTKCGEALLAISEAYTYETKASKNLLVSEITNGI
jgi:hypothetical protein